MPSNSTAVSVGTSMFPEAAEDNDALMETKLREIAGSLDLPSDLFTVKSPLLVLAEIAFFNKLKAKFTLVEEFGPPHLKQFRISLKFEALPHAINATDMSGVSPEMLRYTSLQYCGVGTSHKRAKVDAVLQALTRNELKIPPKLKTKPVSSMSSSVTPTVVLNNLVTRCGITCVYKVTKGDSAEQGPFNSAGNIWHSDYIYSNSTSPQNNRNGARPPVSVELVLNDGERRYVSEATGEKLAKSQAAQMALQDLIRNPVSSMIEKGVKPKTEYLNNKLASTPLQTTVPNVSPAKCSISRVYEIAQRLQLSVTFEMVEQYGPEHQKNFCVRCTVGSEYSVTGNGTGKKNAMRAAAELMLRQHLNSRFATLPPSTRKLKAESKFIKKRKPKVDSEDITEDFGQSLNPISRLYELQQAKKQPEPLFTKLPEPLTPGTKLFAYQVRVGLETVCEERPDKKEAKQAAANSMLAKLGYSTSTKTILKENNSRQELLDSEEMKRNVHFKPLVTTKM